MKTSSIFVARYAGDIFDTARRNDLLIFTDKPSQQIMLGAKPSESGDDFDSPSLVLHDSNVEVPAFLHLNNEVNVNAPAFLNDSVTIDGDLQVNSTMTLVSEFNVGDANLSGALRVTSDDGSNVTMYVESGENIRLNENVVINGGLRVFPDRDSGTYDGSSDVPAVSIEDAAGIVLDRDLTVSSGRASLLRGDLVVRDGDLRVTQAGGVETNAPLRATAPVVFSSNADVTLAGSGLRVMPSPTYADPAQTAALLAVDDAGVRAVHVQQLLFEGPAQFEGVRFGVRPLPSAVQAFEITDAAITASRDTRLDCNVDVHGVLTCRGNAFRVQPSPSGELAFSVDDAEVAATRDVRAACNVDVQGALEVGRGVMGSAPLLRVAPALREVNVDGSFAVRSSNDAILRVSEAQGVRIDAETTVSGSTLVDSNLRVTDDVRVHSNLRVDGSTELLDDLTVQGDFVVNPTGNSRVFSVDSSELDAARDVFARCNLDVHGGTYLRSETEMRAGGSVALGVYPGEILANRRVVFDCNVLVSEARLDVKDGEFLVAYPSSSNNPTEAFRVRDAGVLSERDVTIRGDVETFGSLFVTSSASNPEVAFEVTPDRARLKNANLEVRGGGVDIKGTFFSLAEQDPLVAPAQRLIVRADAQDGVYVNRELEVRSNVLVEDGSVTFKYDPSASNPGFVYDQNGVSIMDDLSIEGDVVIEGGVLRVFPDAQRPAALEVEDAGVRFKRDTTVDSNLRVNDDLYVVGGRLDVEPVEGNGLVLSVADSNVAFRRPVRVTDGKRFECVRSGGDASFVADDRGAEVYGNRLHVGSNADLIVEGGDAELRGGELYVLPAGEEALAVTSDEVRVRGVADVSVRSSSNTRVDVGDAFQVRRLLSSNDTELLVGVDDVRAAFRRDVVMSCNLAVGSDVDIQGTVTSDEFVIKNDLTVGGLTDLKGRLDVTPGGSNDASYTLRVDSRSVDLRGALAVSCNVDVAGEAIITGGRLSVSAGGGSEPLFETSSSETIVHTDGMRAEGDATVKGNTTVEGVLRANTVSSFDGTQVPPAVFADNDVVNLNRSVNIDGGGFTASLGGGNLAVRGGGGDARLLLSPTALRVHRDAELDCNLHVAGDTTLAGATAFTAGSNTHGGDAALEILDDRLVINRDVYVLGGRDVRAFGGTNELFGDLRVNPDQASIPVLNVSATEVDVNRRLRIAGRTRAVGDVDVSSNLQVRGNTLLINPLTVKAGGLASSPDTLSLTKDLAKLRARLEVTEGVEALGDARFAGSTFEVTAGTSVVPAFRVDAAEAVLRRSVEMTSNLEVQGDLDVFGSFAVGKDDDVALAVDSNAVRINQRDLVLDGALDVQDANSTLNGDLLVNPGGADVLIVNGNDVRVRRPLSVEGDTDVLGDLVVRHDVGGEALAVKEGAITVGRDTTLASNLMVSGNTDLRGTFRVQPLSAGTEALSVDDVRVRANRELRADSSLRVSGRTDLQSPLRVNLGGYVAAAVETDAISLNRDVDITSNLHVSADTEITGDLLVNPGDAEIFRVTASKIYAKKDLRLEGDLNITGQVNSVSDARVKRDLRPIRDALGSIDALQGYVYKHLADGSRDRVGFVAQEVMHVVPEVVDFVDDDLYGISYANMVALLAEGVKELRRENADVKARLERLERQQVSSH